ncbi:hypothetical protein [Streptomyces chilikensis]|uniref:Uncharacterized protein n=1 Tax=Streptomyces chilikensis TaxID=1194079 RepID=A0ABV3ERC6_9ACTN
MRTPRYHLAEGDNPPREVTEAQFVAAERRAGFINTLGQPHRPATAGFSGHAPNGTTLRGHITYEDPQ